MVSDRAVRRPAGSHGSPGEPLYFVKHHETRQWFRSFNMSPSGAELLRQVKSQIDQVDPSEVNELIDEGVTVVDVREAEEYGDGHLPGARHVPRSYLESRIEGL